MGPWYVMYNYVYVMYFNVWVGLIIINNKSVNENFI